MAGYLRTGLLLAFLTGLFMVIGSLLGGQTGMVIAFVIALGMNFFSYFFSDRMVLSMYGAHQVDRNSAPEYYGIVETLAQRAGLPMPRVYVIESDQPNAFATGRSPNHAAVAATTGLLRTLNAEEVAGVMAHELAHVKNRDMLIMTMAATIGGAIGMLANFGYFFMGSRDANGNRSGSPIAGILVMVLAPIAAMLVQMAISRSREYEADRIGGVIAGNPLWLASALHKIHNGVGRYENMQAERNPATAHLFIANPLSGAGMDNLFSTHPGMENRIAALEAQASELGIRGYGQMIGPAPTMPASKSAPGWNGGEEWSGDAPTPPRNAGAGPWGARPADTPARPGPWGRRDRRGGWNS